MHADDVRRIALALAGAAERDHHGFPSFRRRTIFATMPDHETLRVMLPEGDIVAAAAEWPWAEELRWGKRLAAVALHLPDADPGVVAELLEDAWRAHD
ncbi:MAG: hypothetical protein ABI873_14150 [Marmoricola sp.]